MTSDEAAKLRGVLRAIRDFEAFSKSMEGKTRGAERKQYTGQWVAISIAGDKLEHAFPDVFKTEVKP